MTKRKNLPPENPFGLPKSFVKQARASGAQARARVSHKERKTNSLAEIAKETVAKYGYSGARRGRALSYYSEIASYISEDSSFVFRKFKSKEERRTVQQLSNRGAIRNSQVTPTGFFVPVAESKFTIKATPAKRGGNPVLSIKYASGRKQSLVGVYESDVPLTQDDRRAFIKSLYGKAGMKKGRKRWADVIFGRRADFNSGTEVPPIDKYQIQQIAESLEPEDEENEYDEENKTVKPKKRGRGILLENDPDNSPSTPSPKARRKNASKIKKSAR